VAGRIALLSAQAEAVAGAEPDVVVLQEVTAGSLPRWMEALGLMGLAGVASLGPERDPAASRGARRYGVLAAARWPLRRIEAVAAPWPERVVSAIVEAPDLDIELHGAYVPQAANGWVKVETLEALYEALARPGEQPRILCGDLNTPRTETVDGRVATFAQRRVGARPIPERGERWDMAERRILVGLDEHGICDVFRELNGYAARDLSWRWPTHRGGYRLDHLLASRSLRPTACRYRHEWREAGLSDHSALQADFAPAAG
jgi:endonuclease/exonuclease/phosphatase family metal-dependent hydrolase